MCVVLPFVLLYVCAFRMVFLFQLTEILLERFQLESLRRVLSDSPGVSKPCCVLGQHCESSPKTAFYTLRWLLGFAQTPRANGYGSKKGNQKKQMVKGKMNQNCGL